MVRRSTLLMFLVACGDPAAFEAVTGTPPSSCDPLYDDVEAAKSEILRTQEVLDACEGSCLDAIEDRALALLVYAEAFTDWSDCERSGLF